MQTSFTALLGIEHPLVQAPIGSASCPELVAAVSNAGGLGMLSGTWRTPETLRRLIRETRALTPRPFGVNLVLAWDMTERVALCLDEGVPLISFFWGDPAPFVAQVHASGARVCHTVASAEEARRAVDSGVDLLVAQGWEAGGHVWGEVTTLALVPRVVDVAGAVPVLAAGGIADGRGVAAALALGAAGAWIGTRFLLAEEARVHPLYREAIAAASETATVHTELFDGGWPAAPHRVLRNAVYDAWEAAGRPPVGSRPGEGESVAHYDDGEPIPRYSSNLPGPSVTGDVLLQSLYAGQGVGLAGRIQPAAAIVQELVQQTRAVCQTVGRHSGYNSAGD